MEGGQGGEHGDADHGGGEQVAGLHGDDRPDQVGGQVPGEAGLGRQQQHPEGERPREGDADGAGVVDPVAGAEQGDHDHHHGPEGGRPGEQADPEEGGQDDPGEGGVAEGHGEEGQAPQEHVHADGTAQPADHDRLQQGPAGEPVTEEVEQAAHRTASAAATRPLPARRRRSGATMAATRNSPTSTTTMVAPAARRRSWSTDTS